MTQKALFHRRRGAIEASNAAKRSLASFRPAAPHALQSPVYSTQSIKVERRAAPLRAPRSLVVRAAGRAEEKCLTDIRHQTPGHIDRSPAASFNGLCGAVCSYTAYTARASVRPSSKVHAVRVCVEREGRVSGRRPLRRSCCHGVGR